MRNGLILTVFAGTLMVFFSDVLFGDRVLITSNPAHVEPWSHYAQAGDLPGKTYRTDAFCTYLPRRVELSRSIEEGRLPLWNPYIFCGAPFFADPQSRVLYPVSLMLVPAEPKTAMGYDVAIHFLIAMIGMYLFLRTVGASEPGGVAGALLYAFSSFFFMRVGHPTFVASASYIPLFFYAYEKARTSEAAGTIGLVVFLVLGYMSGFPQVFLLGVLALLVYAAWDLVESLLAGKPRDGLRAVRVIGISGVLAAAIAAVHMIPFAEFIRNSSGLRYDFETMRNYHMWEPLFLLRSLFPDFFGHPVEGTSWLLMLKQGIHHYNAGFMVYCGAGSIVLLVTCLVLAGVSRPARSLLVILALAVGLALSAPLLKVASAVLPILMYSQIDRVSVIACFALAALSGMAFSTVFSGEYARHRKYFLAAGIPVLIIVLGAGLAFHIAGDNIISGLDARAESLGPGAWLRTSSMNLQEWVGGGEARWLAYEKAVVTKGVVFFTLAWLFVLFLTFIHPRARTARNIIGLLFLICLVADVLDAARSYYVSQPSRLIAETEGISLLREAQGERGMWRTASLTPYGGVLPANTGQVFGVYSVEGRATIVPGAFRDLIAALGTTEWARRDTIAARTARDIACVRFGIAPTSAGLDPGLGYTRLYAGDMVIYENTSVLPKGFCVPRGEASPCATEDEEVVSVGRYMEDALNRSCGSVSIVSYEPEVIVLSVSAESDCFVVFQDTYYPGWKARVDGEESVVHRTDLGFRAIAVGRGEHEVVMEFRPKSLEIGLLISAVGIALGVLYGVKTKAWRRA